MGLIFIINWFNRFCKVGQALLRRQVYYKVGQVLRSVETITKNTLRDIRTNKKICLLIGPMRFENGFV